MARLAPHALSSPPSAPDTTQINLTRILERLDRTLLSTDSDPKLRNSGFERNKVGANLEHARSLLLRLEHDSADIRIQSKKQSAQAELSAKREHIKRLTQRLYELNQLDNSEDEDYEDEDEEDQEDLFPSYAPAKKADGGIEASHQPQREALRDAAENLTSSIRARRSQPSQTQPQPTSPVNEKSTGTTTSSSLYPQSYKSSATTEAEPPSTEDLLSYNQTEQDDLTSSMFSMAQALKEQSVRFGEALQLDSEVLKKTVQGLDKNASGMDVAGQKIGTLRRMTEGKGWFARLKLYGLIAGLWFIAFAIVFILPKFRF